MTRLSARLAHGNVGGNACGRAGGPV